MTDPTNPSAPKIPRKKPRGEPATIDLPSKIVADEPTLNEAEEAREAVATEMAAPSDTASGEFERGTGGEGMPPTGGPDDRRASPAGPPEGQRSSPRPTTPLAPIVTAALLGGVVGAGLLFALQDLRLPPEDTRIAALEQRFSSISQNLAPVSTVQALASRVQALEAARSASEQRVAAAQNAAEQALNKPAPAPQDQTAVADLSQRLAGLEGQVQSSQQSSAVARTSLASQVEDLSRRVSQGTEGGTKAVVRMVLAQRAAEALRLGQPFAETMQALRANGADGAQLAALEPFAEKGAPTTSVLARSFEPLAAAIVRDDRAVSGSITDRLLRMADKVVTIRPVDEPGSSDVRSLVARIQQALDRGNVNDAVAAWESLPEPARRLSEDWAARAKARAAADSAAQAIATTAIAALTQPVR